MRLVSRLFTIYFCFFVSFFFAQDFKMLEIVLMLTNEGNFGENNIDDLTQLYIFSAKYFKGKIGFALALRVKL